MDTMPSLTERLRQMTQRQRGEDSVASEAEIGVVEPPAEQWSQPQEAGRARKGLSPRSSGGSTALPNYRTRKE